MCVCVCWVCPPTDIVTHISPGRRVEISKLTFACCCCQGYLCLPYMALQQHHLLSDVTVRGFVAGATNILFRQQRHLSDAIVEVIPARVNSSISF